jgi:molybdopterin molybdotransferase
MEEDCETDGDSVVLPAGLKSGSNRRMQGEDVKTGDIVLNKGARLRPQEIGMAAAVGRSEMVVFKRLKVAVFSTGDEVRDPSDDATAGSIYDSNRYSTQAQLLDLGCAVTDIGILPDDEATITEALKEAGKNHDLLITSGGVSAGEEDHVKAAVSSQGTVNLWRLAIKPGRPIALGQLGAAAFIGLPGNPVAAFVCLLIFARPALSQLAGAGFTRSEPLMLPAAFNKKKKPGRREYLRARLRSGRVDIFTSEGSGRISGLSWSDGLVELTEDETSVIQGQLVRYLPYSSFGF